MNFNSIIPTILFLFLFLIPITQAEEELSLEVLTPTNYAGERVQAQITTIDPVEILQQKHIIIENDEQSRIPMSIFLQPINKTTTFITFETPLDLAIGTYSLVVKDLPFMINSLLTTRMENISFEIAASDNIISFYPSIIIRENEKEISIKATNRENRSFVGIEAPEFLIHSYGIETTLMPGASKQFSFKINEDLLLQQVDENTTSVDIIFKYGRNYAVPIFFVWPKEEAQEPETPEPELEVQGFVSFSNTFTSLNRTISKKQILEGELGLVNNGPAAQESLAVTLTGNLGDIMAIAPKTIPFINPGETTSISIIVNDKQKPLLNRYTGTVKVENEQGSIEFPMEFTIQDKEESKETAEGESNLFQAKKSEPTDLDIIFLQNISEPPRTKKVVSIGLYMFLIIIIIAVIIYIMRRKKVVKKTTFDQYVGDIEQRKKW